MKSRLATQRAIRKPKSVSAVGLASLVSVTDFAKSTIKRTPGRASGQAAARTLRGLLRRVPRYAITIKIGKQISTVLYFRL